MGRRFDADFFKGVPWSPQPTMMWIELAMTNMDGVGEMCGMGDMDKVVHIDGGVGVANVAVGGGHDMVYEMGG